MRDRQEMKGKFSFADVFADFPLPRQPPDKPAKLLPEIEAMVTAIQQRQQQYQPVFGLDERFPPGPRGPILSNTCDLVVRHYAPIMGKQHIRILDIGCNTGFVTLTLAKTFPNTIGVDIGGDYVRLASALAEYSGSTARFFIEDPIEHIAKGELEPSIVDCALLLNVAHQLIFKYGLAHAQSLISKLSRSVDVLFVELATAEQYAQHGKNHLLPTEPSEVLSQCLESDVRLLRAAPRPLYAVTRQRLGSGEPIRSIRFSNHPNPAVERKYFYGSTSIRKFYRRSFQSGNSFFPDVLKREIANLYKVRCSGVAPRILDWSVGRDTGWVQMERLYGPLLSSMIATFPSSNEKKNIIKELLRIAVCFSECGIYHNDSSPHNFILTSHLRLHAIDFEQARDKALYDQFAFLLWTVNDLYKNRLDSYDPPIHTELALRGTPRAAAELYPPDLPRLLEGDVFMTEFLNEAMTTHDWPEFARKWLGRFQAHIAPPITEGKLP